MKLKSLVIAIGMFASTCAFASTETFASMENGWDSEACIFTQEADEEDVRVFAYSVIVPRVDKNHAMTFESYSFKDTLIAIQMVVCEDKTPQEAVDFVDPD